MTELKSTNSQPDRSDDMMQRIRTAVSGGQTVRVTEVVADEDADILGATGQLVCIDLSDPEDLFQVDIPSIGRGAFAWVRAVEPVYEPEP